MNYACPETGLCTSPGDWGWRKYSSSEHHATKKDVSGLPFVAYRMGGGLLDEELAEEEWIRFVGYGHYAGEYDFARFRDEINGHFASDEFRDLQRNPEEALSD